MFVNFNSNYIQAYVHLFKFSNIILFLPNDQGHQAVNIMFKHFGDIYFHIFL